MSVVHAGHESGSFVPCGRDASRVLLIREAEQIQTFIVERWSYESVWLWLVERYGAAFEISLPAFRDRVTQAVPVLGQAEKRKGEAGKKRCLTWDKRQAECFPKSGTNVIHRKTPDRDELY